MTVVNVALPAIQRYLRGGLAGLQWIDDPYLLTLGSSAVATVVLVGPHLQGPTRARKAVRVDFAGAALCAVGLGALVFGFIEQPRLGWTSPAVPGTIAGGAALLVAFVVYESRTAMPML